MRVERKRFIFKRLGPAKEVIIEEVCRGKSSKVRLELGSLAQARDCFNEVRARPKVETFFRRWALSKVWSGSNW